MRWVAGIMVWVTLIGIIGLLSFGVWYCVDEYLVSAFCPGFSCGAVFTRERNLFFLSAMLCCPGFLKPLGLVNSTGVVAGPFRVFAILYRV